MAHARIRLKLEELDGKIVLEIFSTTHAHTMATRKSSLAELFADYFVSYLFTKYQGTRHVRRIASWIGFVLKGIERLPGSDLRRSRSRQIVFDHKHRHFKVTYRHGIGGRGGIRIVEILPGRGAPEGKVVVDITTLSDAENFYNTLPKLLSTFIANIP